MDIKALIREIPDFPKPGIQFKDITTLLRDGDGLRATIDQLAEKCADLKPDFIVGMESRGFIIGTPLAYKLGIGFIPVRKPGKLPGEVYSVEYALEYGMDCLEVHKDALHPPNCRILIVDDLIATGGTAAATAKLVQDAGCCVVGFGFLIELKELNGRRNLPDVPIVSLVEYD